MNLSRPFVRRPVASSLIAVALVLAGALAYTLLPIAPLPQVDFPTIRVSASLPGASPETMASSVATPLERALGALQDKADGMVARAELPKADRRRGGRHRLPLG